MISPFPSTTKTANKNFKDILDVLDQQHQLFAGLDKALLDQSENISSLKKESENIQNKRNKYSQSKRINTEKATCSMTNENNGALMLIKEEVYQVKIMNGNIYPYEPDSEARSAASICPISSIKDTPISRGVTGLTDKSNNRIETKKEPHASIQNNNKNATLVNKSTSNIAKSLKPLVNYEPSASNGSTSITTLNSSMYLSSFNLSDDNKLSTKCPYCKKDFLANRLLAEHFPICVDKYQSDSK